MKRLTLLLCLALSVGLSQAHEACPSAWFAFGKSCYRFFGQAQNQITAENVCRMFSGCTGGIGHIVSPNTREENEFIFNYLKTNSGANPPPPTWLGGRRLPRSSEWRWGDGTSMIGYTNWEGGNIPQEQGRNCMIYSENQRPTWTHVNCVRQQLSYMCEIPANLPLDPAVCNPGRGNPGAGGPAPGPLHQLEPVPFRCNKAGNVEQRFYGRP